jgi:hypothetical protein
MSLLTFGLVCIVHKGNYSFTLIHARLHIQSNIHPPPPLKLPSEPDTYNLYHDYSIDT